MSSDGLCCLQVYLLQVNQSVTVVCNSTADVVGDRKHSMTSFLSDVTSADVTVDLIRPCHTDTAPSVYPLSHCHDIVSRAASMKRSVGLCVCVCDIGGRVQ